MKSLSHTKGIDNQVLPPETLFLPELSDSSLNLIRLLCHANQLPTRVPLVTGQLNAHNLGWTARHWFRHLPPPPPPPAPHGLLSHHCQCNANQLLPRVLLSLPPVTPNSMM
ncbi:hypothetical protein J6590_030964 [Homalodisca vitripennis]|nr:hypothetical protein J6590_030964 [Homalodisca vitripennis]